MSYRSDVRQGEKDFYWTLPRMAVALAAAIFVIGGTLSVLSLLSQPSRVLKRTLDADHMINNYEFFRDANNQVIARIGQISSHKKILADNTDIGERTRLRIELAAMQQSCRDLVAKYNANVQKINRNIFRGDAPASLNISSCE
jgi:hypothetical protein